MMLAFVGLILTAVSAVGFWQMLPKNGNVHRLATVPVLDSLIPLGIISGFALGVGALVAAF